MFEFLLLFSVDTERRRVSVLLLHGCVCFFFFLISPVNNCFYTGNLALRFSERSVVSGSIFGPTRFVCSTCPFSIFLTIEKNAGKCERVSLLSIRDFFCFILLCMFAEYLILAATWAWFQDIRTISEQFIGFGRAKNPRKFDTEHNFQLLFIKT